MIQWFHISWTTCFISSLPDFNFPSQIMNLMRNQSYLQLRARLCSKSKNMSSPSSLDFDIELRETDHRSLQNLNSIHDASLELHLSRTHIVTSPNLQLSGLERLRLVLLVKYNTLTGKRHCIFIQRLNFNRQNTRTQVAVTSQT